MQLYVQVKPNQKVNRIERKDDKWVLRLHAPAVDGKANDALVAYLSQLLNLPKSKIRLTKGNTARFKCLEIEAPADQVVQCLEKAL